MLSGGAPDFQTMLKENRRKTSTLGVYCHDAELFTAPDEGLEAGAGDGFRDVREELQAELTQEVILPLQG